MPIFQKCTLCSAMLMVMFLGAHQANAVELLSPSNTFRIPPAGTVATYQCEGGKAKTIKYAIETSDRDTLTVKVSGDGKEFGTYRRMAWQMAGTTLFNEMIYKGKVSKGVIGSTNLSAIGIFEKYKVNKSKIYVRGFSSIAEPPLPWHDMIMRVGARYSYQGRPITYTHSITDLSDKLTKEFGPQSIVSMHEVSDFELRWDGLVWSTSLRTEFAPSLGFAIRQEYKDSSYYKTTCELTSIDGPGAAYIAMGQVKPSTSSKIARTNSVAQPATRALVKLALTTDTEPPVLEVAKTIETTSLVAIIAGRVMDQSALSEVIINGVPVALDENGRFSIRRGVSLGESDISVAAVDVWGNVSEQIVKVIRTTSQQALPTGVRTPATPTVVKIVDTTPPVIEIVSGLKTNLEVQPISGRVIDASRVTSLTIGGKPAKLGAGGTFVVDHTPPIGESRLRIAAVDEHGNEAETFITVLRRPFIPKVDYGNYHALIIGNADYQYLPKLQTAVIDAKAVAKILKEKYDFRVRLLTDVNREEMIDAFDKLREELGKNDNLLIYYAGHGWFDEAEGRGYWQPVNARLNRRSNWMSNARLTDSIKALQAKHVMVVADSCYSGVLTRSIKVAERTIDYIERMASRRTRVVLTSGGLEPVMDSGGGEHSVFAEQFLKVLENNTGVLDGTQLFEKVRRPVVLAAPQTPQYSDIRFSGHDGGDFLFVRKY